MVLSKSYEKVSNSKIYGLIENDSINFNHRTGSQVTQKKFL